MTLERIRDLITASLPLVSLFNILVEGATAASATVRLAGGDHLTRLGGSVAGPVQFAMADVAIYALILAGREDESAVTVDLTINFLRPAMNVPLIGTAVPLRAGRRLLTADVRITEEQTARLVAQATGTYALSGT